MFLLLGRVVAFLERVPFPERGKAENDLIHDCRNAMMWFVPGQDKDTKKT